ncbi:hypothetical protein AAW00_02625 [Aurantiacibacter luteus]|uniref:Uncharacterized protein n=2 Tax=Aurantiacibacter luteus TaxID=1581420 RepID=A0A0G9MXS0_9SPHN|nr:hypothetical protein AAW00_02625 [Aurantiacibacter luteus]
MTDAVAAAGTGSRYARQQLVQVPGRNVLVAEYVFDDFSHATEGRLDVFYLDASDGRVTGVERFERALEVGGQGRLGQWSIGNDLLGVPVIRASGGFTGQGQTIGCTKLVALMPDGPRQVASFADYSSNAGAALDPAELSEITASMEGFVPGRSFELHYTGSETATVHFDWNGDRFVPRGELPLGACDGA